LVNGSFGLGPLADHGGPTKTHALLPGSPALDAGDPSIVFNATEFDQRGEAYFRVVNSGGGLRVDIGAYESQGVPSFPDGDHNHDGIADAADYVMWRKNDGTAPGYNLWHAKFGNTTVPVTPAGGGTGGLASTEDATGAETTTSTANVLASPTVAITVPERVAAIQRPYAASRASGHQLLLALDQAIEEVDLASVAPLGTGGSDEEAPTAEMSSLFDDPLASALVDWP
jgi:hypothetical protein